LEKLKKNFKAAKTSTTPHTK